MEARELRIGNLVEYMGKIQSVTSEIIRECELNNATTWPITLTEEWIFKLGFTQDVDIRSVKWIYKEVSMRWNMSIRVKDKITWSMDMFTQIELEYVHQLQNLYFALTGNELILK